MKSHRILPALIVSFIATTFDPCRADCDAVLKLALEETRSESQTKLNEKTLSYYTSSEFKNSFKEGKFNAGVTIKAIPLSFGASDTAIDAWQKQISRLDTRDFSIDDRQYYFETRGLATITSAWRDCVTQKVVIVPTVQGDSNEVQSVIVKFDFPVGSGLSATAQSILTNGCTQKGEGIFGMSKPIYPGMKFDNSGFSATFVKTKEFAKPSILLQTSAGTAVAFLEPFPKPVIPPAPEKFIELPPEKKNYQLSAAGGWRRTGRDNEMDTDPGDRVPVDCKTTVSVSRNEKDVILTVEFACEEYKGNNTKFAGTRQFTIFSASGEQTIKALVSRRGSTAIFNAMNVGKNHGWSNFNRRDVARSYWNTLKYRVDSSHSNDAGAVGVRGDMNFEVTLKSPNPAYAEWAQKFDQ